MINKVLAEVRETFADGGIDQAVLSRSVFGWPHHSDQVSDSDTGKSNAKPKCNAYYA